MQNASAGVQKAALQSVGLVFAWASPSVASAGAGPLPAEVMDLSDLPAPGKDFSKPKRDDGAAGESRRPDGAATSRVQDEKPRWSVVRSATRAEGV